MEIFLIKRENCSLNIIDDYFFKYTSNNEYDQNVLYFKSKKLIDEKHYENFYFNLPFSIISKILKCMESENGDFLLKSVFIPSKIWDKIGLFDVLSEEINLFIKNFTKFQSFNHLERLCNCLIEVQNEFSLDLDYIRSSEYFPKNETGFNVINKAIFLIPNENRDFSPCVRSFLEVSNSLGFMLNSYDLSNYDFQEVLEYSKDYLKDRKLLIAKFYSQVILQILLNDLKKGIFKILRKNKKH